MRCRRRAAWLLTTLAVAVATADHVAPGRLLLVILACGLFGWGFVAATSALIAWAALLVPGRTAPGTSALFIALVLGQAAGSSAAGALSERAGMPTTFVLAALVAVLAALCGWSRGPRPAPDEIGASTGENVSSRATDVLTGRG